MRIWDEKGIIREAIKPVIHIGSVMLSYLYTSELLYVLSLSPYRTLYRPAICVYLSVSIHLSERVSQPLGDLRLLDTRVPKVRAVGGRHEEIDRGEHVFAVSILQLEQRRLQETKDRGPGDIRDTALQELSGIVSDDNYFSLSIILSGHSRRVLMSNREGQKDV